MSSPEITSILLFPKDRDTSKEKDISQNENVSKQEEASEFKDNNRSLQEEFQVAYDTVLGGRTYGKYSDVAPNLSRIIAKRYKKRKGMNIKEYEERKLRSGTYHKRVESVLELDVTEAAKNLDYLWPKLLQQVELAQNFANEIKLGDWDRFIFVISNSREEFRKKLVNQFDTNKIAKQVSDKIDNAKQLIKSSTNIKPAISRMIIYKLENLFQEIDSFFNMITNIQTQDYKYSDVIKVKTQLLSTANNLIKQIQRLENWLAGK